MNFKDVQRLSEKTHKFYSDAAHGWLAVKISDCFLLGISHKITPYSYVRGLTAYLEEDCDMPMYIAAYKQQTGAEYLNHVCIDHNQSSVIRTYERWNYSKAEQVHLRVNLGKPD
jgi:hypothetical protein